MTLLKYIKRDYILHIFAVTMTKSIHINIVEIRDYILHI
jgi:hypothetical protein